MQKVTVYYYTQYDINTDQTIRSKRMATLDAIKTFSCIPLMDTAQEIDVIELDDIGRYPIIKS